jgi:hypothetical protein
MIRISYVCAILLLTVVAESSFGQIPRTLSYQGMLTDTTGVPKLDGTYTFTFRLYQIATGGNALWTEQKTLSLQHGLFSTNLGDQVVFPASLTFDRQYWLGIQVASNPEMTPRIPLTSSGYSFSSMRSGRSDTAGYSFSSMRSERSDTARFALAAPAQSQVDSARIAGTVPNNVITRAKIAPDQVVTSLAGLHDDISISAGGGLYSFVYGDTLFIHFVLPYKGTALSLIPLFILQNNFANSFQPTMQIYTASTGAPAGAFSKGAATTLTATAATIQAENLTTLGEGMWLRNSSAGNPSPVFKLHRHPSATSNFIDGVNWDGVNAASRKFHIDGNGTYTAGSDFAEAFDALGGKESFEPGDVVVISVAKSGSVEKSSKTYDVRVVGVYSTRPGVVGADKDGVTRLDQNDIPVAIMGVVPTKVTAENGAIEPGDLLTTSSLPGHAMKAPPVASNGSNWYPPGTIIGKALEPLRSGTGLIKVLINVR